MVVSLDIPLEWHRSKNPRANSRPLIILVHHFGGNSRTTKRHSLLLMDLGYNSVSFSLSHNDSPLRFRWAWGVVAQWGREIIQVLSQLDSAQPVVLFSLSGPGAATLHAVSELFQEGKFNIKGLIFDSGPFMDAWDCTRRLLQNFYGIKSPLRREAYLVSMMIAWGLDHNYKVQKSVGVIANLKPMLPILSIRAGQDELVPARCIDAVFKNPKLRSVEKVVFPSKHLAELRDYPEEYKNTVGVFLERFPAYD